MIAPTHTTWRLITSCVSCCFAINILFAQTPANKDLLLQPFELLNKNNYGHDTYIHQAGSLNEVNLYQQQMHIGPGHLAQVIQTGQWNVAIIAQHGNANRVALLQSGQYNLSDLLDEGNGNQTLIRQEGDANRILHRIIGSNGLQNEFVQMGNNNEISSWLEGLQGQNFTIRQIGDGLKIIVRQNP